MSTAGERPRLLIAEPESFDSEVAALLSQHAEVVLRKATVHELARAFEEFDAVWIRLGFRIEASMLSKATRCRVLACPATGLDHIDLIACQAHGIRVVSLKGEVEFLRNVRATAEHTIALMLALTRKIPWAAGSVLKGTWNRDRFRGRELHEKTIGLVGMGRLGSLVAKMLTGFELHTLGFDPRVDFPGHLVERVETLDMLLARSDVVSIHVSYERTTHHLIGAAQLSQMRPTAFLINTSRGGVLDEAALLAALGSGALAGAALDVMEGEPHAMLDDHPLVRYACTHDNLLIVPHIGGNTWESTRKTELFIARKVLAALAAGPAT